MSIHRHTVSFKYALSGLHLGINTQPNFRIHLTLSLLSIIGGIFFQIGINEWFVILILIGVGLAIEYLNTAIEYTVDLVVDQKHLLAKYAKDCAAAAMLIYAVLALVCAAMIFLPKIISVTNSLWLYI